MPHETTFSHDYSLRDSEIVEYGFYEHPALPNFPLRGPAVDTDNADFFACVGAAQTLGVYVAAPFPVLLTQQLGLAAWNLGVGGASPNFFLQHPHLFEHVNRGKFAVLQMMTARDEPNDRMESTAIAGVVTDRRAHDVVPAQIVWQRIMEEEPDKLDTYIQQSRQSWQEHMGELLSLISVPVVPFWFAPKQLDATIETGNSTVIGIIDDFPQFVSAQDIEAVNELEETLVCCFSDRDMEFDLRSRNTGLPTEVDYAAMDQTGTMPSFKESRNIYYPSPQMHWDAAVVLGDAMRSRGLI